MIGSLKKVIGERLTLMQVLGSLVIACLLPPIVASAQTAAIKKIEIAGEKIIVHYDLDDSNPANEYQMNLYASQSNFATALTKVRGDVGNEIKPGSNKKIEWNVREELGPYKGKLSLELRGRMFIPVAKINSISAGDKYKRGKSHSLTWKPGNSNQVTIELLKSGQTISTQPNQPNNGSFSLFIPPHTVLGNDYSVRITDTKDGENASTSRPFSVTRKVPLLLKVVPVLGVAGVLTLLAGGGKDAPEDGAIVLPELP